ncbi:hypothetical protein BD311DRAFT_763002 [Dichomitus squalens]|uniref:DUF5648 domain-containing protein n=1 Tax=Dichomitus squalens TaxID=114155 RepID=A0A4Q9MH64_9APHY|nr:hypothetical protein BD311DRAFT_763002 [Dichomitus squalens]
MKFTVAAIVCSNLFALASASPTARAAPEPATVPDCGYSTVPLLRAYSKSATAHFYTTNATEMAAFVNGADHYVSEGVAAQILPSDTQAPSAVPLFRLYGAKSTDYFYTANTTLRDEVLSLGNYVSQGVAGYVYPDQECGTVPLYRLHQEADDANFNFYTTDEAEVDDFVNMLGYDNLGVTGYVNPQ